METCSLHDFMAEMNPWLDTDHVKEVRINEQGNFLLQFRDGMNKVYHIDDCNKSQVTEVLNNLKEKGIPVSE